MAPLEIRALGKIMDELDYYQLLHLEPTSTAREIKTAYYATSRTFHPDATRHLDPELKSQCSRIAKRVTEAYCVLRDPRRRKAYDGRLEEGVGKRIQLAEARAEHDKAQSQERQGKTAQGRQFYQKAENDAKRRDYAAAINNLQMALTFERDNAGFQARLEELKKLKKQSI